MIAEAMLAELEQIITQPQFARRYGLIPARMQRLMRGLRQFTAITPDSYEVKGLVRDAEDDKLLACAIEGRADYLVTGDKDLLELNEFEGVQIVTPAEFVSVFAI